MQSKENTYDLEANLAVLKLYQFNPHSFNIDITCQILLKALTNLPNTDFILCKCLLTDKQVSSAFLLYIIFLIYFVISVGHWSNKPDYLFGWHFGTMWFSTVLGKNQNNTRINSEDYWLFGFNQKVCLSCGWNYISVHWAETLGSASRWGSF